MKHGYMVSAIAFTAIFLTGCEAGVLESGSINARWTLAPNSCESLHIKTIEARAVRDGETVIAETVPCVDSGELLLDGLDPATYTVEIEGFNSEESPRGTHMEIQSDISVLEGQTEQTMELRLVEKQARVHVRWKFPDGFGCIDNGIQSVAVGIYDQTNRALDQKTVGCDVSFTDPDDGTMKSGVLFDGLTAAQDLIIIVDAYDAANEKVFEATLNDLELFPGDTIDAVVTFE
jgi:hypothetical protein